MSTKSKGGLFSRKKNSVELPADGANGEHTPTTVSSRSPAKPAGTVPTASALDSNPHPGVWRGAEAINADGAKHIGDLRTKTRGGVVSDLENHVGVIENLLRKQTEGIIAKYEEAIAAIEKRHKDEIIDLERRHKELLTTAVTNTWAAYEKKMEESRLTREIHFEFAPTSEHEPWSQDIEHVVPEVKNRVPKVYNPNVHLHEPGTKHKHGHHRLQKHHDATPTPDGHEQPVPVGRLLSLV